MKKFIKIIIGLGVLLYVVLSVYLFENHSGFFSPEKQIKTLELSPLSGEYQVIRPAIKVPNAENATVVVYLHGINNSYLPTNCNDTWTKPPASIQALTDMPDTYIYTLCSTATDGIINGIPTPIIADGKWLDRRIAQVEQTLDDLKNAGVNPNRIFLTGQSAGAWTMLNMMSMQNTKFNGVFVMGPACCNPRTEKMDYSLSNVIKTIWQGGDDFVTLADSYWHNQMRPKMIARMTAQDSMSALIFAYEDDAYNRPQDLQFLTDKYGDSVKIIPQNCGNGHATYRNDCNRNDTISLIKDYMKKRLS